MNKHRLDPVLLYLWTKTNKLGYNKGRPVHIINIMQSPKNVPY